MCSHELGVFVFSQDEDAEDVVWDENSKIIGTSESLEKQYLRLTSVRIASISFSFLHCVINSIHGRCTKDAFVALKLMALRNRKFHTR